MNTHKAFILGVALLSTIGVKAQFAIDDYKAVFTSSPQHVPTTKTPDAPLAGNGDIGIVLVTVYHDIIHTKIDRDSHGDHEQNSGT